MKKAYVNQINKMLEDPEVKGKNTLRKLLWLNTVTPKYSVGDCLMVTDHGHRVFGVPVKDFRAKVVDIEYWPWMGAKEPPYILYRMECHVRSNGSEITTTVFMKEAEINPRRRCKGNMNVVNGGAEPSDATELKISLA